MSFALLSLALAAFQAPTGTVALITNLQFPAGHRDGERTAVCVVGELRTHYHPRIQRDLKENFHHEGYEYFYSNDVAVDPARTALNPIRAIITADSSARTQGTQLVGDSDACPAGSDFAAPTGLRKLYADMTSRYVDCYNAMLTEEKAKGFKYDYVMRIRPDHFFDKEVPSPKDLLNKTGLEVLFFDDHISLAARKYGDVVLYTPQKVALDCHTPSDCEKVCQDEMCRHTKCGRRGQWLNLATKYRNIPSHRVFTFFDASVFEKNSVGLIWGNGHKHCGGDDFNKPWFQRDGDYCYLSYFR